jgi:hypothetical protein
MRRTGRPIPNAYVSSDCYPNAVSTDADGRYELKTRWSSCTLTVFAPGYRTRIVPMEIEDSRYPQQERGALARWGDRAAATDAAHVAALIPRSHRAR